MAKILSMDSYRPLDQAPVNLAPWRVADVVRTFSVWRQRRRERAQLAQLDPRLLNDIGLHPSDVEQEIRKPFWRG